MPPKQRPHQEVTFVERVIASVGSVYSVLVHTVIFLTFFVIAALGYAEWSSMLLVLTTLVSLEAIYLAIFIQITVNQHTASLREVEEDIDEIQEDVEELGEDFEDIQEDIEEISKDIDEIQEDVEEMSEEENSEREAKKVEKNAEDAAETLEKLTRDVARVLADLEALKKGS